VLGAPGGREAAIARVDPALRTQAPLQQEFVDRLNETNDVLGARIEAAVKETARGQFERQRRLEARRKK